MINLNFNGKEFRYNKSDKFIHTKGGIFYQNRYLTKNSLNTFLSKVSNYKIYNGSYCYIKKSDHKIALSVDCVRSMPIFYSILSNKILISDSANWLESKINKTPYDLISKIELWLSGFVMGNKTIHPQIKQIPAGNILYIDLKRDNKYNLVREFEYSSNVVKDISFDSLLKQHEFCFSNCINRLIARAKGRTIVIPLSSGLDSRLLALQLKLNNYKNVICFSYGKLNNSASIKSKITAKKLGFKWLFVEYNSSLWRKTYNSELFNDYFFSADNLSSLPHIQDWISLNFLKTNKLIPNDSILVPGHTGDFLSTGHIPPKFNHVTNIDILVDEIIIKHFRINNFNSLSTFERNLIKERIKNSFSSNNKFDNDYAKELFQYFDWSERQSKFIINSVRVYDFFNFDWALPFWYLEIVNFWRKIPFSLKKDKFLYKSYIKNIDTYNVFDDLVIYKSKKPKYSLIDIPFKFLKMRYILFKNSIKKRFLLYFSHSFQWYGMFSYKKIIFSKYKIQNINTFLVNDYLKKRFK
jgi:asparagine synthase (glutamine-hydrolysing)